MLTTIITVLSKSGMEYTSDMNIPFESKYWNFEKDLKTKIQTHSITTKHCDTVARIGWTLTSNSLLPVHSDILHCKP